MCGWGKSKFPLMRQEPLTAGYAVRQAHGPEQMKCVEGQGDTEGKTKSKTKSKSKTYV